MKPPSATATASTRPKRIRRKMRGPRGLSRPSVRRTSSAEPAVTVLALYATDPARRRRIDPKRKLTREHAKQELADHRSAPAAQDLESDFARAAVEVPLGERPKLCLIDEQLASDAFPDGHEPS